MKPVKIINNRFSRFICAVLNIPALVWYNKIFISCNCLRTDITRLRHYVAHIHQFRNIRYFPIKYFWQHFTKGYMNNKYEIKVREYAKTGGKSKKTKMLRSITPQGFAKAFYEANK